MKMLFIIPGVIAALLVAIFFIVQLNKSRNWPTVQGHIHHIEMQSDRDITYQAHAGNTKYRVDIIYTYTVNQQEYTGHQLMHGIPNIVNRLSEAEDLLKQYSIGSKPNVYYNPKDPKQSALVIFKRTGSVNWLGLFFALFLAGGAIGLLVFAASKMQLFK